MKTARLVDASYVAEALGVSKATAYRIIRSLNDELQLSGVLTRPGRVNLEFFEQKYFYVPSLGCEQ